MAKLKKSTRRKAAAASKNDLQATAEQISRGLTESAQQIWLAGVGALQRAQTEGSKLFDALVKEGSNFESTTRKLATVRVDAVRDAVEERVDTVRGRAVDTWDRLEKVFEERVQRALTQLGVPTREDLTELNIRVEALTRAVRQRGATVPVKAVKRAAPTATKSGKTAAKAAKGVKPTAQTRKLAKTVKPAAKAAARKPRARKAGLAEVAAPQGPQG